MDIQREATQPDESDGVSPDGTPHPLCLGYDPGQHPDPAALALVRMERREVKGSWDPNKYVPALVTPKGFRTPAHTGAPVEETHYILHFLQVLHALPYPDQVAYLAELLRERRFWHRRVTVRVDITGVGTHPCEALSRELKRHPESQHIRVVPVRFVYGDKWTPGKHPESLGKGALVATLLQRLQWRLVHAAPAIADLEALAGELEVFNRTMDESTGNTSYGAQSGRHDDRVIALGLAILEDAYVYQVSYGQRLW